MTSIEPQNSRTPPATPSEEQTGWSPRTRALVAAASITSVLAGVGFGPRAYRAAAMTGSFDPEVVMPALIPSERFDDGYRLEVNSKRQTVERKRADLAPDDWVTGAYFDPEKFPEQLGAFLLNHPTLEIDFRQYVESIEGDGRRLLRLMVYEQREPRSLTFTGEKGKSEFPETECELRVYACAPQSFPSVNARNESYRADWFDSLRGRGRTRSSPRSGIHVVAKALKEQFSPDEVLVDMFPIYPMHYRPYPEEVPWVMIARRRPRD